VLEHASSGATFLSSWQERRFREWSAARMPLLGFVRRRPHDALAAAVAIVAAGAVALNALWFQPPHPAPMFHGRARPVAGAETTGSLALVPPSPAPPQQDAKADAAAPARPKAPAAAPISAPAATPAKQVKREPTPHPPSAKRIAAVQRALADFGYGQVMPTGVPDAATKSAIERFERERKLPVTGHLSERVMREVAAATGRRLD
jgi:Putative peptidoglycan binding domain